MKTNLVALIKHTLSAITLASAAEPLQKCPAPSASPPARRLLCALALGSAGVLVACSAQGDLSPPGGPNDLTCTNTGNCVNSLPGSDLTAFTFDGPADKAMTTLLFVLASHPQAQVTFKDARRVEAVFTTTLGFRDDVSFRIDPDGRRIDFRSRSRLGKYDFGKNRSRMKELAAQFAQHTKPGP